MLCIMDTKKKVLIAGALTANRKLEEVCNNVIMANEVESDDAYDIVIVSCVASLLRETPIGIENYVDRVVNNYSYCKFQQHFRMPLEAFEKLLSLVGCVLENETVTRQDSNILKRDMLAVISLLATADTFFLDIHIPCLSMMLNSNDVQLRFINKLSIVDQSVMLVFHNPASRFWPPDIFARE